MKSEIRIEERDNKLHDSWLRLFGTPVLAFIMTVFASKLFTGLEAEPGPKLFIMMLALTFVTWESSRQILLAARKKYPGIKHTQQRIVRTFIYYTINVFVITGMYMLITIQFHLYISYSWTLSMTVLFISFMFLNTYTLGGVYEGIYFFRHWKRSTLETEQLKRESLQTQFESLKNQVNPHFLFNSLNSLSSLIEEDTDRAEQFVQEMSQVYRYLLQTNDKPLTTLGIELDFIKAYFYLLKTRFSEGLKEEISIPGKYLDWQIPPLTLQLLVENAVKHNVVSSAKPLTIKIFINTNNELIVANNLQKKSQSVLSNKIGLENIAVKYRLLNQGEIVITETAGSFEVKVPLIGKEVKIESKENEINKFVNA